MLSIDPGNEQSAWIILDTRTLRPVRFAKEGNDEVLEMIERFAESPHHLATPGRLVIEQIACMGMAVGAEVLETVFWSGRFCQAWRYAFDRIKRHEVKMALCHNMRAKDPNIRQALIDRYGGKDKAIGRKAQPGPLYGISNDVWAALSVAVTWADRHTEGPVTR